MINYPFNVFYVYMTVRFYKDKDGPRIRKMI